MYFIIAFVLSSFYVLYYSSITACMTRAVMGWALHGKLTELILQSGSPSYHLTSWSKSALVQKPSTQIPKAFYQHGKPEKAMVFRHKCFNIANYTLISTLRSWPELILSDKSYTNKAELFEGNFSRREGAWWVNLTPFPFKNADIIFYKLASLVSL